MLFRDKNTLATVVRDDFDEAVNTLKEDGFRVMSLEEAARIKCSNPYLPAEGNKCPENFIVKEGAVYVPNKGSYIVRKSPLLYFPHKATKTHQNLSEEGFRKNFYVSDNLLQEVLSDSIKISNLEGEINSKSLNESEIARFCFGEYTEEFGKVINENITDDRVDTMFSWIFDDVSKSDEEKPYAFPIKLFETSIAGISYISYEVNVGGIKEID